MAENTTRQIDRWQQGEAITAYRLNQLVDAVNFLLNTTGYIFNRVALANYVPTDASSFNYPGILEAVETRTGLTEPRIEAGTLVLPEQEGGLTAVTYSDTARTPSVSNGTLYLNRAYYDPSSGSAYPGSIVGVQLYDPTDASSPTAPGITAGFLQLPAGISEATYTGTALTPSVSNGTLKLNLANYDSSSGSAYPGSIAGLKLYDPSDPSAPDSPGIAKGVINLPDPSAFGVSSVSYGYTGASTPTPGVDGWVQTLYLWGLYTGNLDHLYATRLLMRVNGSVLEVVQQITYDDGNSWVESSA